MSKIRLNLTCVTTFKDGMFITTPTFHVITFGPFASANVVLTSLSHAIGNLLNHAFMNLPNYNNYANSF